jgi:DNA repair protein RecN (Recombination protein N)
MLKSLRVRNLAVAENVSVEFGPGFNAITGETGAGKSILVGALALLLGERADKTLIRTGEEQCSVEAVFELPDPREINGILDSLGLPPCEGGLLVFRRTIRATGGQILVNDSPVTLQALKQIGDALVDMHGPHDHQSLFRTEAQLAVLDAFGRCGREREAYAGTYARIQEIERRKAELSMNEADLAQQVDLLEFRVREIEQAEVREGEEEEVRTEHLVRGNAQRILELAGHVAGALTEQEACAFNALVAAQRPMEELSRLLPAAEEWRDEIAQLAARVQELGVSITREAEAIEAEPARLEWLDQRMAAYQKLKRKYGGSVAAVLETLETSRTRLKDLRTRTEQVAALDAEAAVLRAELEKRGQALRKKRTAAAGELGEAVTGELEFLGFPGSAFAVELGPREPQADGMDHVEFGFAPNVGESMRPLRQIASSGEISRLMLATKAVLAEHDRMPVLVFDEIDANLGGEMGHAVGRELAGVATRHQVICITHLPQVAAHGTLHHAVRKVVRDGRTFTQVDRLEEKARIEELARMLGGGDSRAALAHAVEMLARARRKLPR